MLAINDGFGWYLGTGFGTDTVPIILPQYPADEACTFEVLEAVGPALSAWSRTADHARLWSPYGPRP